MCTCAISRIQLHVPKSMVLFSLEDNIDLKQDFPTNTLELRNDYEFKDPANEDQRMRTLYAPLNIMISQVLKWRWVV